VVFLEINLALGVAAATGSAGFFKDPEDVPILTINPTELTDIAFEKIDKAKTLQNKLPLNLLREEICPFVFEMTSFQDLQTVADKICRKIVLNTND